MKFIITITIFSLLLSQAALYGSSNKKNSLKSKYQTGTVELIPTLRINNESLPEGEGLKNLSDFALSPNNSIFALDSNQNNIKIFSQNGTYLKTICQKGAGPNDLDAPFRIISNGSQLIVWEIMGNRFSFFSPTGEFQKIVRVVSTLNIKKMKSLPNGRLLIESEVAATKKDKTVYCRLDLYTKEAQLEKNILKLGVERFKDITKPFPVRINYSFVSDMGWDTSQSGNIFYGFRDNYRIYVQSMKQGNGKPSSFVHQTDRIKITGKDKKRIESSYRMMSSQGMQDAPRTLLDQIPYPKYRPIFGNIVIDSENNILVFPWKQALVENYDYFDAFDASGKFTNRVKFASRLKVPIKMIFTPSNRVWILTMDDSEEKTIIMNEIK